MPIGIPQTITGMLCVFCNTIITDTNRSELNDHVCEVCSQDNFSHCEGCSETYYLAQLYSNYRIAESLGFDAAYVSTTMDTGEVLCDSCSYQCDNCGERYAYDSNSGECCYENSHYSRCMHDYSYRPVPIFYSGDFTTYRALDGVLYMGMEIEIEKMRPHVDEFVNSLPITWKEDEYVYFKSDGSLMADGAELVTMPADITAINKVFPFAQLETARENGARSFYYDSCGFHIHVSRSAFTPSHMWKFVKFQLNNPVLCQKIGQRYESSYASWHYMVEERSDLPEYVKGKKSNGRRYLAINFQNRNTVELRYFKGNILKSAILKNVEFVQSIYDYTKSLSVRDIVIHNALTEESYLAWLEDESLVYPNLYKFITGIYQNQGE